MQREIKKKAQLYGVTAVLLALILSMICYNFGVNFQFSPEPFSLFKKFSSYNELRNFLQPRKEAQRYVFPYYPLIPWASLPPEYFPWIRTPQEDYLLEFSILDSEGIVPLAYEGTHEYSTTNIQVAGVDEADIVKTDGEYIYVVSGKNVLILKAYPPEEAELLSQISLDEIPKEIFVSEDKLAVLGGCTFVKVYDISDRTNPVSTRNFKITGSYLSTRRIEEYLYLVVTEPARVSKGIITLPKVSYGDKVTEIPATEIYYSEVYDVFYVFTTIVAINLQNDAQKPVHTTILLGGASCMYISLNNVYITFLKDGNTLIYRIHIEGDQMECAASGEVPGRVLNQFSMDEYEGYFRIATTTWIGGRSQNNVYVMNMSLGIVGRLENLAPGERIYSARFMGTRCYLVTFVKVDPLFVIDLEDPTNPKVLGELKITGYSDYLHPYDENHIIGIGKETVAGGGNFALYQGVKLSLFDVSNVSNPRLIANYTIGDRGTDSPVLRDHKAFLFDRSRNLLVIPVKVVESESFVWQGAYVFNITLSQGFVLKGTVAHLEKGMDVRNSLCHVKRALYIDDVLYTVSTKKVKMNSLDTLDLINEIELP